MKIKLAIMFITLIFNIAMDESNVVGKNQTSGRNFSQIDGKSHPHHRPGSSRVKKHIGASEVDTLIYRLRELGGVKVHRGGKVSQPFFSAKGRLFKVRGEDVQVFEYATEELARADAKQVNPGGCGTSTTMPMWIAPPHFYRSGRVIVLYIGENERVLKALGSALGPQFAGR